MKQLISRKKTSQEGMSAIVSGLHRKPASMVIEYEAVLLSENEYSTLSTVCIGSEEC